MFELIKVVIEQAFKLIDISALLRLKQQNRLGNIGAELFALYMVTNKIYVTGCAILRQLTEMRKYFEEWKSFGAPQQRVTTRIKEMLKEQSENINEFKRAFRVLSATAAVLDPKFTREAGVIVGGKAQSILDLVEGMSDSADAKYLFSASREHQLIQLMSKLNKLEDFREAFSLVSEQHELRASQGITEAVADLGSFDLASLVVAEKYVEQQNPAARLEDLRVVLDNFHEVLTKNFEVKDLLLRVGERHGQ